jgi:hypothetical protein
MDKVPEPLSILPKPRVALHVVVKYEEHDAFVVTAYLTDKPKAGEELWPRK